MVDLAGLTLTPAEAERLRHPLVGGVILFTRNFRDRSQLAALTAQIRAARHEPLLIAVDHEGGRVQRFREDGFTQLPAMRQLGRVWEHNSLEAQRAATDVGFVLAAELRACGVDLSFAPVLDLDWQRSGVIGERALHGDARVVTPLARALVQGMAQAGMASCGKHFPGHGWAEADSHHAVPVDDRPLEEILAQDAAPYAWLGDLVLPSLMPAHVIYPQVDAQPAGFSQRWIGDILRQGLAYDGVVFSDDLTMAGAAVAGDILARAEAALGAGCDMVLVCNHPELADELLARLQWQHPAASVDRIRRLRPRGEALAWQVLQELPAYRRACETVRQLSAHE